MDTSIHPRESTLGATRAPGAQGGDQSTGGAPLVYRHERPLGLLLLVLGSVIWLALIIGTVGVVLLWILSGFLIYLFAQSAFIAWIRGNGVELSASQFPDLHEQFIDCCEKLDIQDPPKAYVLAGGGMLNAFATKFLGREYIVLLSDVVDAMQRHPDGVRFYIGHELGHLRMKHLHFVQQLRWPAMWLPLLGAAYSRAMESTCDLHGRACCSTPENAVRALAALAAGSKRWADLDLPAYRRQSKELPGFWMSFHELTNGYPWLVKRAARVLEPSRSLPTRHPLAWPLALLVPYGGRLGGGLAGLMVMVAMIGVLAAVALPAYTDYQKRAEVAAALLDSQMARSQLGAYLITNGAPPQSLEDAGLTSLAPGGRALAFDPETMTLSVDVKGAELLLVPRQSGDRVRWVCQAGDGMRDKHLPQSCRSGL